MILYHSLLYARLTGTKKKMSRACWKNFSSVCVLIKKNTNTRKCREVVEIVDKPHKFFLFPIHQYSSCVSYIEKQENVK